MKVVVVGAGISGLFTYLYLKQELKRALPPHEQLEIVIYERYPNPVPILKGGVSIGGFLGIAPNGLKVIRDLDGGLYEEIVSKGSRQTTFRLRSSQGWNIGQMSAENFDTPPLPNVLISRHALWESFRQRVPDCDIVFEPVKGVSFSDEKASLVVGEDASSHAADLIVGADGVHSVVREAVAGDDRDSKPEYVGLVGVGGLLDPAVILPDPGSQEVMTITFGANGFFGYAPIADQRFGWWSTYAMPEPPESNKAFDRDQAKRELQERHQEWSDPNIQTMIANVEINSIYPTFVVPALSKWSKANVVLIGDAAHAMQPSAGQGVSQALEDVQVLSIMLAHFLQHGDRQAGIKGAFDKYQLLRVPRVQKCVEEGNRRGDQKRDHGRIMEYIFYGFMWAFTHLVPVDPWRKFLFGTSVADEARALTEKESIATGEAQ